MSEKKEAPNDAEAHDETSILIEGEAVDVTARNKFIVAGTGLVGGIVGAALVGAGLYYYAPIQSRTADDKFDTQLADLAAELKTLDARTLTSTGGLYTRVSNVEESVRGHTDQIGTGPIADRLQALQGHAAQVQEDLAQFDERLKAVDVDGFLTALTELQSSLDGLTTDVRKIESAQLPADLPERVGQLAQGLNAAAEQINSLSLTLHAVEEEMARPDPTAEAALGIALANLTRAIDAGQSFVAELNAIATLAPQDPAVASLLPVASQGVKTFASLKAQFVDLVDPLLVAERQAGRESFWDRFVGNVMSVVTVRRVGDVEGDGTEAIVARIETRLQAEDLAGALAEARQLAGAPADLIAPWITDVEARVTAFDLVRGLSARVLAVIANNGE